MLFHQEMFNLLEFILCIDISCLYSPWARIYIFEIAGKPNIYISSADWMTRNFENRIEVTCPIYDTNLQNQILDTFDISWRDNVKSRFINELKGKNKRKKNIINTRSQFETYRNFKNLSS